MLTAEQTIARFAVLIAILACGGAAARGATEQNDESTLNTVFGDAYLADNVQRVRRRMARLSLAEYPVEDVLSAASVILSASASGTGRVTEVTWKRLSYHGKPLLAIPLRPFSIDQ